MTVPPTATHQPWPGVIAAYRDRLPVGDDWTPVTLLEGGTPLIAATNLSKQTGCTIHLKVEGLNPTGSFKDRGMTMAVTDALPMVSGRSCAHRPEIPRRRRRPMPPGPASPARC